MLPLVNLCTNATPFYKGTLYDLGAGESPYKDFFLQHADDYIAVDWAGSYHAIRADIVADLNAHLPIESEVADAVVSLSVLEHLREPQTMLDEAFRILKPGGGLVLQVPWQWWIHEAPHDFFRYTPYGLEYLLKQAGFIDIQVEPQAGFFTMMVLKLNYFSLRLIRGPRPLRWMLRGIFGGMWYLGQKLAPSLDKLDRNWALEASGYFATARKP
ncbi:methyltransferase domain-containing protein [Methylococcus capsulatus]|uniref:methyltransferase domain-containing protein n=1 Tax=Methylococcus capsulatus TaxID=414 RepID=UPI001C52CDE5|nr:class I SAM-dependent methyltransferase [Methylococcus capsulatus]QXP88118.1 class I SAM-dependent methyltransferase [Methylococcus capsulatus]QXP90526.1 class I SAM-dependent methyltransferase [Methylococcus capsulatus]UQN13148.1 class I SAM-dependent methyltransferase [Methylococcus capsulatus]